MNANTEYVARRLAGLDARVEEWDEDYGEVDLDRDDAALQAASERLDGSRPCR